MEYTDGFTRTISASASSDLLDDKFLINDGKEYTMVYGYRVFVCKDCHVACIVAVNVDIVDRYAVDFYRIEGSVKRLYVGQEVTTANKSNITNLGSQIDGMITYNYWLDSDDAEAKARTLTLKFDESDNKYYMEVSPAVTLDVYPEANLVTLILCEVF